ncbi:hypothetical protein ACVRXQ_03175 [Streptococcus panodentis]|uniref:hypothetical protein n=1 Tax=Streptococcus panodentis TaxID=1581472 RepID=UPI001FDA34B0|nr:hypothetical protein [Streptococcus panodentis]
MKKVFCFALLTVSLIFLSACSLLGSEQGWTTISQSKNGDPSYHLQAKGRRYRILFEENASTRMDWYLNDYQPGLELKMRTLNREEIQPGGSAEQELSGQGYGEFTMVYETRYKPQIERSYFKVRIELDDQGQVDTKKSSMTYWKTETEEFKKAADFSVSCFLGPVKRCGRFFLF